MNYEWLLIDADDTLFDYDAAEVQALERAFADFGLALKPCHVEAYRRINKALWLAFEGGAISQQALRTERFRKLFQEIGITADEEAFSSYYLVHLGQSGILLPGAKALLEALAGRVGLALITNGIAAVQRSRLACSGLERYFDVVVISEEVGAAKPDQVIFDAAFVRMGNPSRSAVFMVGDSLSSDMAGAIAYGVDACWFNPQGKPRPVDLGLCYEIRRLDEVLDFFQPSVRSQHSLHSRSTVVDSLKWWQKAVFYQIYPRSFADGNSDGIGDVHGMITKLDYLAALGVEGLWLSPHYPSPQADCGYDVADYCDVAPEYGTLDDFRLFLEEAHKRGLRVILDMVFNHTSDQHAWFLESKSSRDNPKRDWYVWRDGKTGPNGERIPPNNWEASFTGSAWEYDPGTDQYYYHFFLKEQPDLNWRNPEVKAAMWDAVRFWLEMGVDGFRLDAIGTIFEDPAMPDHTSGLTLVELYQMGQAAQTEEEREAIGKHWMALFAHQVDRAHEMHPLMKELRQVVDAYPDRVLVAEDSDVAYHGNGDDELHLVFNFPLMRVEGPLTPAHIRRNQAERLAELPEGAWPCNTLGNHDSSRVKTAFGDGTQDDARARLSMALMLTLRGTPFIYNGEEIGMTDAVFTDIAQLRDMLAVRQYELAKRMGMPESEAAALACAHTRDRCRTPMQWEATANAGFSPAGVETWLPVNPNYAEGINVAGQQDAGDSMLNFTRQLIAMRKRTPALVLGNYAPLLEEHPDCFCFLRATEEQTCLVVLNFSAEEHTLDFGDLEVRRLLFSSTGWEAFEDLRAAKVAPFGIAIVELEA